MDTKPVFSMNKTFRALFTNFLTPGLTYNETYRRMNKKKKKKERNLTKQLTPFSTKYLGCLSFNLDELDASVLIIAGELTKS